jgi:hypothetical protein
MTFAAVRESPVETALTRRHATAFAAGYTGPENNLLTKRTSGLYLAASSSLLLIVSAASARFAGDAGVDGCRR